MLDSYLKRQNRFLTAIMILIGVSMVWGTLFLLSNDCAVPAVIHASMSVSILLGLGGLMRSNCKYIAQCVSIANIERGAFSFDDEDAIRVIDGNVPDLGFKFHRSD